MDITGRVHRLVRGKNAGGVESGRPDKEVRGSQLIDTELAAMGLEVAEELGRGGFGVVYRARQPAFERTVAVKVLSGLGAVGQESQRFEREIKALGSLGDHPHIVTIYDAGTTPGGWPFIVMADMPGGSLGDQLRSGLRPDPAAVTSWGVKLAGALAAAHAEGVLHRDIKPENVLLDRFGEPALGDFGIARIRGATETRSGVITGSLAHAAPEMLGSGGSSEISDVYSLGSTLYTLLAGKPAFVDDRDETPHALVARILNAPVPDLTSVGVPPDVATVIVSALAREPAERAQSAESFGRALQAVQRDHGWAVTPLIVGAGSTGSPTGTTNATVEKAGPPADVQPTRTHHVHELLVPPQPQTTSPRDATPVPHLPVAPTTAGAPAPARRRSRMSQPVLAGIGLAAGLLLGAVLLALMDSEADAPSVTPVAAVTATTPPQRPSPRPAVTTVPPPTPTTPAPPPTVAAETPSATVVAPAPAPRPRPRRSVAAPRRTTRPRPTQAARPPAQPAPERPAAPPPSEAPAPRPTQAPPPPRPAATSSPRPSGPGCQDCTDAPPRPGCQDCAGGNVNSAGWAQPEAAHAPKVRDNQGVQRDAS